MAAPSHLQWQYEQARARRRLARLRRLEIAGFYAASVAAGFALGVLVTVAVS